MGWQGVVPSKHCTEVWIKIACTLILWSASAGLFVRVPLMCTYTQYSMSTRYHVQVYSKNIFKASKNEKHSECIQIWKTLKARNSCFVQQRNIQKHFSARWKNIGKHTSAGNKRRLKYMSTKSPQNYHLGIFLPILGNHTTPWHTSWSWSWSWSWRELLAEPTKHDSKVINHD